MALASASRLFSSGCEGIHHAQIASYYRALVMAPKEQIPLIKPGMKASWYKQFLGANADGANEEQSLLTLFGHLVCKSFSFSCQFAMVSLRCFDLCP